MNWTATLAAALGVTAPLSAFAQDGPEPAGFSSEPLLKTTTSELGEPLTYPTGTPEVTSVIATLEPGGRSGLHQHPVPVYVYVMEGELEVRTEGSEPTTYGAGEAFFEAQNRNLQVFNAADTPTRILVVMMGQEGQSPFADPQ